MKWQEKNSKTDPVTQSSKPRDADASPCSPAKEIPILQRKQSGNSIAPFQPSSPKKTDGMPSGYSIMRRRRSSEGLSDESFTGTRVINFSSRGEHVVHCGKCLGKFASRLHETIHLVLHIATCVALSPAIKTNSCKSAQLIKLDFCLLDCRSRVIWFKSLQCHGHHYW